MDGRTLGLSRRRGAQALEFALVMPVVMLFLGGAVDYGWFFYRESLVASALRDATKLGAREHAVGAEIDAGGCAACLNTTQTIAIAALQDAGFSGLGGADLGVSLRDVAGACAVVAAPPAIPHQPLVGLVPSPTTYNVQLAAVAI